LCRDEHVGIDWSEPARIVYDLVRGADPQPGAWAIHGGEKVRFYDCRLRVDGEREPGRLLSIGEDGAEVGLAGGSLLVGRVRVGDSGDKVSPAALAEQGRLRVGDRFGSAFSEDA
jgi:methionyl-tRNA formyltransferase